MRQVLKEPFVDLFDEVVALLIEGVDSTFDGGDLGVGGERIAGLVFFVPEGEVGAVFAADQVVEIVIRGDGGRSEGQVPRGGPEDLGLGKTPHVRRLPCVGLPCASHGGNCISQR